MMSGSCSNGKTCTFLFSISRQSRVTEGDHSCLFQTESVSCSLANWTNQYKGLRYCCTFMLS